MCKRTVIVSGGMLEEDFVLPILEAEETEFIIGVDKDSHFFMNIRSSRITLWEILTVYRKK